MISFPKNIENVSPIPAAPLHKLIQKDYVFGLKYLVIMIAGRITGALLIPKIKSKTPKYKCLSPPMILERISISVNTYLRQTKRQKLFFNF